MRLINKTGYVLLLILSVSCAGIKKRETIQLLPVTNTEAPARTVFTAKSSLPWVSDLVRVSNCVINNKEFIKEIGSFPKYDFTTINSLQVAETVRTLRPVTVSTYRTLNPFSKTVATTYVKDPTTLYLNLHKHPRPMVKMVNTVIHEGLHPEFGHGSNYAKGKENSVNYRVGSIAEKYVEECQ